MVCHLRSAHVVWNGQGCELGHGTAARVRAGFQSALVELSTREPKAGCLVAQCYLRYRQPTHAQIFTPVTIVKHLYTTPHNPPADCCLLHIGIILPKKST